MAKYKFTRKAVEDLSKIWNYTYDTWSENQADIYYKMILDTCQEIAVNPDLGKNYDVIVKDLYGYKAGRHIIFYRILDVNQIEILRILHDRMDLRNRIDEGIPT